jgi:hypothetical protein
MEAASRFLRAGYSLKGENIQTRLLPSLGPTTLYKYAPLAVHYCETFVGEWRVSISRHHHRQGFTAICMLNDA